MAHLVQISDAEAGKAVCSSMPEWKGRCGEGAIRIYRARGRKRIRSLTGSSADYCTMYHMSMDRAGSSRIASSLLQASLARPGQL
jgi:hypothetical protein